MIKKKSLLLLVTSFLMIGSFISCSRKEPEKDNTQPDDQQESKDKDLIYNLKFLNSIKENNVKNEFKDAEVTGGNVTLEKEHHKDAGILSFENASYDDSYLILPAEILENDVTTIATWVLMPENIEDFNDQSPLFSIGYSSDGYFYPSPFDRTTWFGYSINSKLPGQKKKNLTLAPISYDTYWENTPISGTLQSPAGAWQLIGFTFTSNYLNVYQNGKLMLHFEGDYNIKDKGAEFFYIGNNPLVSTTKDFNAKISDFRVYKSELNEKDYIKEFDLTYDDFLTTYYEFNESYDEEIRGFDAKPQGNVKFATKDDKEVLYLDGSVKNNQVSGRTSLTLPKQVYMGHNEITVSTDIYLINSQDRYQRVFEFSIKGKRYFALFIGFSDVNDLKLEWVPNEAKVRHIVLKSGYKVPTDKWINITVTANKEKGIIYVDGVPVAECLDYAYDPVIEYYYPDITCTIGRTDFYNDKPLSAYIDNFKMYSVALSEKEVMLANNVISIEDDNEAVNKAMNEFELTYKHETLLNLPTYGVEGVKLSYSSDDPDLIDSYGNIYKDDERHEVGFNVTFTRGEVSMTKKFDIVLEKRNKVERYVEDASLDKVTYDDSSYFNETMLSNIDYMFSLNTERLLYNYRLNAGLPTNGVSSYGGWISTSSGGASQFESQYVGALARYALTKPNYVASTAKDAYNTPLKRLTYMLNEIRKCQVAYGEKYPEQKGYLCGFTHLCMKAVESGTTAVSGGDGIHGQIPIGGVNAWVPFYMYHKNLMMCYDVYTYAPDEDLKALALTMLIDASDWVYNEISSLNETERSNTLGFEYGGMPEVSYLTYKVTNNKKYLRTARFFEQESLLDSLYKNVNCLQGIHSNTTIPKILGCAIAYEVTGSEYYRVICENFFNMIKNDMSYVNGGVSKDEHFEKPGVTSQCCYGEETCCSYNMLMLTNYLYRWTGKASYMDYFENVFYNHIMASIDPSTGGKTYPNPTNFGYHKIFSAAEDAFWCCCCTGQETFSKLVYGNIHENNDAIFVDMYNPISYEFGNSNALIIKGNLFIDEKVHISFRNSGPQSLRLRKPSRTTPILKLNGSVIDYNVDDNGYIIVDKTWSSSDDLIVELPMKARLEAQKGTANSYALFYGPLMCVANLGKQTGDVYISTNQSQTYKNGGWVYFDGEYTGPLSQTIYINGFDKENINDYVTRDVSTGKLVLTIVGRNETVNLIPWMDCIYERYSMYMYYRS